MHQQWESRQRYMADFQRDLICEFCGGGAETYVETYHPEADRCAWVHACQGQKCDGEGRVECNEYVTHRLTVDLTALTYDFYSACEKWHLYGEAGGRLIPDDHDALSALGLKISRSDIEDQLKEMEADGW